MAKHTSHMKVTIMALLGLVVGITGSVALAGDEDPGFGVQVDGTFVELRCPDGISVTTYDMMSTDAPPSEASFDEQVGQDQVRSPHASTRGSPPGFEPVTRHAIARRGDDGTIDFVAIAHDVAGVAVYTEFHYCSGLTIESVFPIDVARAIEDGAFINDEGILTDG